MESPIEKFQRLLRELFQFDCADLDFGIYRIMNHKRDAIERFIRETLPKTVAGELDLDYSRKAQSATALKDMAQRVRNSFGPEAIGPDGELSKNYLGTPLGHEYMQAREQADDIGDRIYIETDVYNRLYEFFNRYYQEGDFISKRRYSRRHRYAIPYNGEEVYLHWANSDQYYIKTAEHFRDYDWKAPGGVVVRFELRAASVEQDNVKGDKRFFLPLVDEAQWDTGRGGKNAVIPFEYRSLTAQETIKHGGQKQQDKINTAAIDDISSRLAKLQAGLGAALLGERRRNGNGPVSHLEHHLRQYTRRNSSDFFIHRDLKGFLSRELDFYLKNEVLNLDEMKHAGEQNAEGWFQKMRLVKAVGSSIIDFLAQIENFQKMLWEKRKFITETHYCISVGSIPSEFYPDIAKNKPQWIEWHELFKCGPVFNTVGYIKQRISMLRNSPTLVLDTKHFDCDFVDKLLASFNDLDDMIDGLLVHSENWQALNLLTRKYKHCVKAIYIDPPYNSPSSEIIYKNGYKHSTFLSIIYDRVLLSKLFFKEDTVHVMAIDENEYEKSLVLLKSILKNMKHTTVTVVNNPSGQQSQNFSYVHDYACFAYYSDKDRQINKEIRQNSDDRNFRDVTGDDSKRESAKTCFYPIIVKDGKIVKIGEVCERIYHPPSMNVHLKGGMIEVYPIDPAGVERKWRFGRDTVESIMNELYPSFLQDRQVWDIKRSKNAFNFKTVWNDAKYSSNNHGTQLINNIFGYQVFDYPKSIYTVTDCLKAILNKQPNSLVLDYFAGSGTTGHATINLNREDGNRHKFILVEMGEYFNTVLLPRIKKTTYSPEWKGGKPQRMATQEESERGPRIIKYIHLESYEDALNGIEFDGETQLTLEDKFDDYLLKYMLQWETKMSRTLLNVEKLASPFSYKLCLHADGETKVKTIDIPETFNYLLGLNVHSRRSYHNYGKRYLVYRGETSESPGSAVAVIWRKTDGWQEEDFESDKTFVKERDLVGGADTIYVNGDSLIPNAKPVEKIFRDRMFAGVDA